MVWVCVANRPAIVCIPISQNRPGFLRDGLLILISRWLGGAEVAVYLHGSAFDRFYSSSGRMFRAFIDLSMRSAGTGIVLGDRLRPEFARWIPPERIAVVPNGVVLEEVSDVSRKLVGEVGFTVLFLGNLLKFKGVAVVIDAALRAIDLVPGLRVVFGGRWTDDPMYGESADSIRRECLEKVSRSGHSSSFEFLGEVDRHEVTRLLYGSDVLVLPSENEGLPMVIIEAMAAGLPVIASRGVGTIPDVVIDGETGILVPPREPGAVAEAIVKLASDPELRRRMGQAGQLRYKHEYTVGIWTERLKLALTRSRSRAA